MSGFVHDHFLLGSETARRLFHEHAAALPIVDYHCHLDPHELAADRTFENIAQLWVTRDPYKHRAMRIAGVPEEKITGAATEREKFIAWAATCPLTLGNPLHHWTALELKRYFALDTPLSPQTADEIWDTCNSQLRRPTHSALGLLAQRSVACVCTSDRLLDDLAPHAACARRANGARVLPSLRADDIVNIDSDAFLPWLGELATATRIPINSYDDFRAAVALRLDAFAAAGCRLSDHGLDAFQYRPTNESTAAALFARRLRGEGLSAGDTIALRSALLLFLGREYARRGWILQLHLGAQRNTSSRLRRLAGPAGGYATIGNACDLPALCAWFDDLERGAALPRIILYPLNPADFVPLAVLTGSFAEDGVAGKLQLGPAWWFNDHASGIRAQLDALANHGLLSTFIGMTTDSRSLLSLARHEYFRRVLCDYIGKQVESGALPHDEDLLSTLIARLCHDNARASLNLTVFP